MYSSNKKSCFVLCVAQIEKSSLFTERNSPVAKENNKNLVGDARNVDSKLYNTACVQCMISTNRQKVKNKKSSARRLIQVLGVLRIVSHLHKYFS